MTPVYGRSVQKTRALLVFSAGGIWHWAALVMVAGGPVVCQCSVIGCRPVTCHLTAYNIIARRVTTVAPLGIFLEILGFEIVKYD